MSETERYFSNRPLLELHEFEVVEAPVVEAVPAGESLSPEAAAPEAPSETEPPAVETAPTPAWTPDDPAFREAVERETHALVQAEIARLVPQTAETPAAPELPELDPFDPAFAANLAQLIRQNMEGVVAPLLSTAQQQQDAANQAHWNTVVEDVIADETSRNGDLSTDEIAALNLIAVTIMPQMHEKYGQTPRAVEATVQKAAAQVRAITAAAEARAVERYKNELGTLGGARTELPGGGGGGGMQGLVPANSLAEVNARFAPLLRGEPGA